MSYSVKIAGSWKPAADCFVKTPKGWVTFNPKSAPLVPILSEITPSASTAVLNWVSGGDGGSPLTMWVVQMLVGQNWTEVTQLAANVLTYSAASLPPQARSFRVLAVNAVGSTPSDFQVWNPTILPAITGTQTAKGEFRITNYNGAYTYAIEPVTGEATLVSDVVTLADPNGEAVVTATSGTASTSVRFARRAYTYDVIHHKDCTPNCKPGGGADGPNSCWCGTSGDGYQTCCGGCYGETCNEYDEYRKQATPDGYSDSNDEWWRVWTG